MLSNKLLLSVFEYLPHDKLFSKRCVCKRWKNNADQPTLWKEIRYPFHVRHVENVDSLGGDAPVVKERKYPLWNLCSFLHELCEVAENSTENPAEKLLLRWGVVALPEDCDELSVLLRRCGCRTFGWSGFVFDDPSLQDTLFSSLATHIGAQLEVLRIEGAARIFNATIFTRSLSKLKNLRVLSIPYTGSLMESHIHQILEEHPMIYTLRFSPCGCGMRPQRVMDPLETVLSIRPSVENLSVMYREFSIPYGASGGVSSVFSNARKLRTLFLDKIPGIDTEGDVHVSEYHALLGRFIAESMMLTSLYISFRPSLLSFRNLCISSESLKRLSFHTHRDNVGMQLFCPVLESLSLRSREGSVSVVSWNGCPAMRKLSCAWKRLTLQNVSEMLSLSALSQLYEASFVVETEMRSMQDPVHGISWNSQVVIRHPSLVFLRFRSIRSVHCSLLTIEAPHLLLHSLKKFITSGEIRVNGQTISYAL